ncbi:MFS general substrate transporter [Guyanagaster necrorhizus]|uniref:MFS general substrate transporter n=1 Tax=Guyanagaster necrorhizus TaxID=856835 RepID=A0A9P8AU76_9AGAR|nr:MFS general substrate transporter [Guyanagaster necrorhizus MCA 3950]KAG7447741.1 MFS general substrate transporter [Guyanagaster necrorhizus MCA 3950]
MVPRDTSKDVADSVSRFAAQDKTPWYRKPNLRLLYLLLFPACIGVEMTSGFDSSMMNGLQAVDSWDTFYHSPRSTLLGLMSAIYSLGAIAVLLFVPYVTDHLGRRWAIVFGSVLMIVGAALQTASQNFAMFVCSRLVLGFGIPFVIVAASSLIGELSHPKERAVLGSLFSSCWFIGSIVAAGITLGTFNMDSNWGGEEAYASLVKYHAEGDVDSEFVKAAYAQIEKTLALERETAKTSWLELVATSGMRKRLIIGSLLRLFTQWSGNGLTSYYLARILDNVDVTDNRTKDLINLANTYWSFSTAHYLSGGPYTRYAGITSILFIFTGWTVASANYTRTESHGFIFLYSPAYNMAFNALTYTFLVELFPFHVRAKGITVFQWFSRTAGFFNQFVNPIGIANAGWKYYLSCVIWIFIEVLVVFFLFPETSHKILEIAGLASLKTWK